MSRKKTETETETKPEDERLFSASEFQMAGETAFALGMDVLLTVQDFDAVLVRRIEHEDGGVTYEVSGADAYRLERDS